MLDRDALPTEKRGWFFQKGLLANFVFLQEPVVAIRDGWLKQRLFILDHIFYHLLFCLSDDLHVSKDLGPSFLKCTALRAVTEADLRLK